MQSPIFEANTGWTLTKLEDNVIRFAAKAADTNEFDLDVRPNSIEPDTWYHVAVTRRNHSFKIYWNGVTLGTLDFLANLQSTAPLKIGHRGSPADTPGSGDDRGFYFNGYVDEVQIFNRALGGESIANIYRVFTKKHGSGPKPPARNR